MLFVIQRLHGSEGIAEASSAHHYTSTALVNRSSEFPILLLGAK